MRCSDVLCLFSHEIEYEPFEKPVKSYLDIDVQIVTAERGIWLSKLKGKR